MSNIKQRTLAVLALTIVWAGAAASGASAAVVGIERVGAATPATR